MPSRRVAAELNSGTYFLTLTIPRWYYLFDRHNRWQILADSLRYFQRHKGLELNDNVFMLNHIHLIVTCSDVARFLRDFKRNMEATEPGILRSFVYVEGNDRFWIANSATLLQVSVLFGAKTKVKT